MMRYAPRRRSALALALMALIPKLFTGQISKPAISSVGNVASYANASISPGEILVIFGRSMGPSALNVFQVDEQNRIASVLAQVRVLFDGTPAPLIYVWDRQIVAMVPYEVAGKSSTQVQVVYQGIASDAFGASITPSSPGIFTADASGTGQAAMTNSDGSYNSTSNPAKPGTRVTFYVTGAGQTDPPGSDGAIAPSTANVTLPVTVRIAGRTAEHLYAGTAPGNVNGLAQIDVVIPPDLQYGGNLPLTVQIGDSTSQPEVTLAVSVLPAPVVQATALSSSQVRLTWSTTATGIVRFRIERRTTTGAYAEINQPSATSTAFDDSGLSPSTGYWYRMRVETGAGISPYSNEVTATTLQAAPAAPTNLQATAISSSQVNLTWTNNAPDATAVRVEFQPAGSSTFADIGTAASLTSTGVTNLQPNTAYSFRVRAQNGAGYSAYSNVATTTTLPVPKTVFLIHGIGQGSADMQPLFVSLTGGSGIDPTRFRVDYGFDFSECADTDFCSPNCSIAAGAQKLAQYIANAQPPGDIILIGFSMGGLIARDMMANGRLILNGRRIPALVTLGTPNLGYPYTFLDTALFCTPLVQQMNGNWRSQQSTNQVVLSPYLLSLTNQWPSTSYPGGAGLWLAASGRSCSNAVRAVDTTTGCRDRNPYSDGVVCDDSATYSVSTPPGTGPNRYWQDPGQIYVHSNMAWGIGTSFVLCGNSGNPAVNPPLSNPPTFGPLFAAIKGLINGL